MNKFLYNSSIISAVVMLLSTSVGAQHNYGVATSNWSGFNSLYLNPANIADSKERLTITVVSLTAGVENNLGSLDGSLFSALKEKGAQLNFSNTNQASVIAPYAEVRGPGAIYAINSRHSIALTTGVRAMNQFNNFNQSLYRSITDNNYTSSDNIDLTSKNFNYTAQLWDQVGLSYGGVVYDEGHHEIRVGATVRYLGGIGYVGLKGKNLDAHFRQNNDSFYASNSDLEYASNVLNARDASLSGFTAQSIIANFFNNKAGSGIGGDIGVTYDYIPGDTRRYTIDGRKNVTDGTTNRYLLRFSASVIDIGAIKYSSNDNYNANVTGNGYLTGDGLQKNVTSYNTFRNYVVSQGFHVDTIHAATKLSMPTTLMLGADYHAYKAFYVNLAYAGNLVNRDNYGNSFYNQVTLTPRFDTRLFSLALPISYGTLSHSFKVGIGARFSGFFIGSDDMLALVASHQYGFNFYAGGCVPLYRSKIHDRDNDGVSDKKDRCPDEFGTWANHGCPEKEMNGDQEQKDDKKKEGDKEEE